MIRINQLKLKPNEPVSKIETLIRKALKLKPNNQFTYEIFKRSIDARKKDCLLYVYSVNVTPINFSEKEIIRHVNNNNIMSISDEKYQFPSIKSNINEQIIIIGSGPAGLFCGLFLARAGYKPVIFERGSAVHERTQIVNAFWETGNLDIETNVQFGEGGAGTFSDGKLNTAVKEKSGRIRKVLETFVEFGAPKEILYDAKPHIGTDILKKVVSNIRNEIINLGGMVHFNSKLTDIEIIDGKVKGITINSSVEYECDKLVLAIGHSARDTFSLLRDKGLTMESKAFAVGLRVEHPQSLINEFSYGAANINNLPVPSYKVTAQASNNRGVYSFCMCPGGYVVNASSEEGHVCVNGMSYSDRGNINANSAIIVTVSPEDYNSTDVLSGVNFQRKLEKAAYIQGKGGVCYQLNEDFSRGIESKGYGSITPSICGKHNPGNLREVLPEYICESVIDGMKSFDKMIKGFNMGEAVFSGVESRTSSPVKMLRNDSLQSVNIKGLYPCGEGAGYAGGITSAAVDGIKVFEAVVSI